MPDTQAQETVACICPSCGSQFAVLASNLGTKVECPICSAVIVAGMDVQVKQEPDAEPRSLQKQGAVQPRKRIDKRAIAYKKAPGIHPDSPNTTKLRKFREEASPVRIEVNNSTNLAEEEPEYKLPSIEAAKLKKKSTWHIWMFVFGLVLLLLGGFMYIRGQDLYLEGIKEINVSDKFVDHEADFSSEVDKSLMKAIKDRAERYQLTALTRKQKDLNAERVTKNVSEALNELALFCMATSDDERLKYVVTPEETAKKMALWGTYVNQKEHLPQNVDKSAIFGDLMHLSVLMDDNTLNAATFIYNKETNKWQLDWEAWSGYSSVLPTDLIKNKPSEPVTVRAILTVGAEFKEPFLSETTPKSYRNTAYINVNLEFPNGEIVPAYVDRYSQLALDLIKMLQDGPFRAMVKVHYPSDLHNNNAVIIDEVIRPGWLSEQSFELGKQYQY